MLDIQCESKHYGILFSPSLQKEFVAMSIGCVDTLYLKNLHTILSTGEKRKDRTGVGTLSVFGLSTKYAIAPQFPILRTKKLSFHNIKHELLWFLRGDTNIKYLRDNNVNIWNEWADEHGELGPVYGSQWRRWPKYNTYSGTTEYIDQIKVLEDQLKNDPYSRRMILSAWNVSELDSMKLPPCHMMCQFYVRNSAGFRILDCQMYQRSADYFLGVPYNIASYALLVEMLCAVNGFLPGVLTHVIGDAHIYLNHIDQVKEQLSREERIHKPVPFLGIDMLYRSKRDTPSRLMTSILDFVEHPNNLQLIDYIPMPAIKAPIAV